MLVKCHFCESKTNKIEKEKAVRIDDKNFHPACAKKYLEKKELSETICRIFKLHQPGPKNYAWIKKYIREGLTYKGINNALVYFYEIKRNDTKKANEGIGIVPWVYEEAEKYFYKKEKGDKMRLEAAEKNSNYEVKQIMLDNSKQEEENLPSYLKPIEFVDAFENEELK